MWFENGARWGADICRAFIRYLSKSIEFALQGNFDRALFQWSASPRHLALLIIGLNCRCLHLSF